MRTQNILLMSLFVSLYGCQPEAPKPTAAAPVAAESPALPAQAGQAAQPVASEAPAPVQQIEPVSAEKAAQTKEKIAAVVKEKAPQAAVVEKPAPVQATATSVAKIEPAPVVAEAKPEVKSVPAVSEVDALQLVKKNNCFACHAVDKKVVGPSFKDVAAKYRGDAEAEARLADKIAKGGGGVWGTMAMPASPKISEADCRVLAKYVLSLK